MPVEVVVQVLMAALVSLQGKVVAGIILALAIHYLKQWSRLEAWLDTPTKKRVWTVVLATTPGLIAALVANQPWLEVFNAVLVAVLSATGVHHIFLDEKPKARQLSV